MKNMKKLYLFSAACFLSSMSLFAQLNAGFTYQSKQFQTPLGAKIVLEDLPALPEAHIILKKAMPAPLSLVQQKKQVLDEQRLQFQKPQSLQKKSGAPLPIVGRNFGANVTNGTPNDNDYAISNAGLMLSCVNSNILILNDTGRALVQRSLSAFGNALGPLNRTYDPRTIYDPIADRFIVVYLQGSTSADTRIIVGFSETNDPTKAWNLYQIPGNITGDSSWSDYPIISLSKTELFITVNRLRDNSSWQEGFIESYIWQVETAGGYAGDSLVQKVYNNILYNNKPVWSICPAKGGSTLHGPDMYFLSHRPADLNNDTVFVHYITNTIASGKSSLGMRVLKNPQPYGLQPNALMPNGRKLQTNDARVLSAMYEGGVIYYVGNTINPNTFSPSVYFGRIHDIWTNNPRLEGDIISSDSLDLGYPSIAYIGTGENGDHSSMITFSHVSDRHFPGTSVAYVDRNFKVSSPVFVKRGEGNINLLLDSVQRWGDYTGIQKKYNELGVAWLSGSWGTTSGQNRTWIGKVNSSDPALGIQAETALVQTGKMYPNPANEWVTFEFEISKKTLLGIEIMSLDGRTKKTVAKNWAKPGLNELQLDTRDIPPGLYIINLVSDEGVQYSFKCMVRH